MFQLFLKTVNGGCFFDVKKKFVPFCRGGKSEWTFPIWNYVDSSILVINHYSYVCKIITQDKKFDSTYRAFGYHCSLHQYDVISRWHWRLTGWGILLAFPLVSSAIWRLRHTDEGCSDSRKLCKCCQIFYPM